MHNIERGPEQLPEPSPKEMLRTLTTDFGFEVSEELLEKREEILLAEQSSEEGLANIKRNRESLYECANLLEEIGLMG